MFDQREAEAPPGRARCAGRTWEADIREVEGEFVDLCGSLNAGQGRLVSLVARGLADELWQQWGIHSPKHWLMWQCGLAAATADKVVAMATRWDELPATRQALCDGRITLDQAAVIARHTPIEYEVSAAELAQVATVRQLQRVVSRYQWSEEATPVAVTAPSAGRRASVHYDDDALLHLRATFDADEGARVERAIEVAFEDLLDEAGAIAAEEERPTRADAIVRIADAYLASGQAAHPSADRYHVDAHLEAGPRGDNLLTLTGGPVLPSELRRLVTCDGSLAPVLSIGGVPVETARSQRIVPARLRRLLMRRDGAVCRIPGCDRRAGLQAHHIVHWEDGGETLLSNLVMLCRCHHRMHHKKLITVSGTADDLTVLDGRGRPIPVDRPPREVVRTLRGAHRRYAHPIGEPLRDIDVCLSIGTVRRCTTT